MESNIEIFKNERFGEIRVAGTSDEPLFCLADICRVLDFDDANMINLILDNSLSNQVLWIEPNFFVDVNIVITICTLSSCTNKEDFLLMLQLYNYAYIRNLFSEKSIEYILQKIMSLIPNFDKTNKIFTYIVYDEERNIYKIGRTKDVKSRIRNMLTYVRSIIPVMILDDDFEQEIHKDMEKSKHFGEWFSLKREDFDELRHLYKGNIIMDVSDELYKTDDK